MSYANICRNLSSNKQTLRIVSTQIKKFYQTLYRLIQPIAQSHEATLEVTLLNC